MMKNFEYAACCIKCGYWDKDASVEYKVGVFSEIDQENVSTVRFGRPIDEYLLRTRQRCGYKWAERTVDKYMEE